MVCHSRALPCKQILCQTMNTKIKHMISISLLKSMKVSINVNHNDLSCMQTHSLLQTNMCPWVTLTRWYFDYESCKGDQPSGCMSLFFCCCCRFCCCLCSCCCCCCSLLSSRDSNLSYANILGQILFDCLRCILKMTLRSK
jgi:hypothetical protein